MTSPSDSPSAQALKARKDHLRKAMLQMRREIPRQMRHEAATCIKAHLCGLSFYQEAKAIMVYVAMPGELPTRALLEQILRDGKTLLLPRCEGETFQPVTVTDLKEDLVDGPMRGLRDPRPDLPPWPLSATIDLVLAPGLAFDRSGMRMGYGKGMYDRFLSRYSIFKTFALCFEKQIIDEVPSDHHDRRLDGLLSEAGLWEVRPGS